MAEEKASIQMRLVLRRLCLPIKGLSYLGSYFGRRGAAKAVKYVLDKHNIAHKTVSRKSELNFDNLTSEIVKEHTLIIQTTPVGTFPNVENCLVFPFEGLSDKHLIIDLIYNPNYTKFIKMLLKKSKNSKWLLYA